MMHLNQEDRLTITSDLEVLLTATGQDSFQALEQRISVFCPFEAIGMVRQELKHSNFLSFIFKERLKNLLILA